MNHNLKLASVLVTSDPFLLAEQIFGKLINFFFSNHRDCCHICWTICKTVCCFGMLPKHKTGFSAMKKLQLHCPIQNLEFLFCSIYWSRMAIVLMLKRVGPSHMDWQWTKADSVAITDGKMRYKSESLRIE